MSDLSEILVPDASLEVIKRGETSLTMTLHRSAGGLTLMVKAHPQIETFMRGLGTGEQIDVKACGPVWRPISKRDDSGAPLNPRPLMIYNQTIPVEPITIATGDVANINRPGQMIIEPYNDGISPGRKQLVNLSFLRIVGISEGAGVAFTVRGVHTYEAVNRMREQIGEAYKVFYRTYMKPIRMDIVVSTQEVPI